MVEGAAGSCRFKHRHHACREQEWFKAPESCAHGWGKGLLKWVKYLVTYPLLTSFHSWEWTLFYRNFGAGRLKCRICFPDHSHWWGFPLKQPSRWAILKAAFRHLPHRLEQVTRIIHIKHWAPQGQHQCRANRGFERPTRRQVLLND